jgi:hypothetical protein
MWDKVCCISNNGVVATARANRSLAVNLLRNRVLVRTRAQQAASSTVSSSIVYSSLTAQVITLYGYMEHDLPEQPLGSQCGSSGAILQCTHGTTGTHLHAELMVYWQPAQRP